MSGEELKPGFPPLPSKAAWRLHNDMMAGTVKSPDYPENIYRAAAARTERLQSELDIRNADHIALWLEANMKDSSLAWLACRIVEAHERSSPPQNDAGVEGLREAIERFIADYDDGDRADAGTNPLMQAHIADLRAALRTPMSELQALGQEFEAGWRPYIGQEVRAASHIVEKWPDWQDTRLWVVGIAKDRLGNQYPVEGINITVSDEWPVTGKTGGFTDGFYIGRRFEADDLIPSAPSGEG